MVMGHDRVASAIEYPQFHSIDSTAVPPLRFGRSCERYGMGLVSRGAPLYEDSARPIPSPRPLTAMGAPLARDRFAAIPTAMAFTPSR